MNKIEIEKARDRVHALRARLSDTCCLLDAIARNALAQDNDTRNNMLIAIREIYVVSDELATVCGEHLADPIHGSLQPSGDAQGDLRSGLRRVRW
ncbi:MAG: hypothetical protein ABIQ86_12750 [Steroidobacteraceae bacterium]